MPPSALSSKTASTLGHSARAFRCIVRCLLLSALACAIFAQVESSTSIRGLVTDATGAAVVGASVTIKNKATNEVRSTTTNDTGFYAFPSVVPGTYDIEVSHPG